MTQSQQSNDLVPNPGSNEAQQKGCTCPVMDNGYGDEELGRIRGFWISGNCPLHGVGGIIGETIENTSS